MTNLFLALALIGQPKEILDFTATWCGPCRQMAPAISALERAKYPVRKVDIDAEPGTASRYEVTSVPTLVLVDARGGEIDRRSGVQTAASIATWYKSKVAPTSTASKVEPPWRAYTALIESRNQRSTGHGTGTVVAADGEKALVLTNRHVVRDGQQFVVQYAGNRYEATPIRIASDSDLAALTINARLKPFAVIIADSPNGQGFLYGYKAHEVGDQTVREFHRHVGAYQGSATLNGRVNDQFGFKMCEGESGSPIVNERGELVGIGWGYRGNVVATSLSVQNAKLRGFLATPTCFRFFRRQPRQINVNVNSPSSGDPIAAVPTPPVSVNPEPIPVAQPPAQIVTAPTVTVPGATGATGLQGPTGLTGATGAIGAAGKDGKDGAAAPAVDPPLLQIAIMKNGVPQLDASGQPISKIYRPVAATDPTTGAPALMYKVGLEPDTILHATPSSPAPAK